MAMALFPPAPERSTDGERVIWGSVRRLEARLHSLEGQGVRTERRAAELAGLAQALTEEQRALLLRLDRFEEQLRAGGPPARPAEDPDVLRRVARLEREQRTAALNMRLIVSVVEEAQRRQTQELRRVEGELRSGALEPAPPDDGRGVLEAGAASPLSGASAGVLGAYVLAHRREFGGFSGGTVERPAELFEAASATASSGSPLRLRLEALAEGSFGDAAGRSSGSQAAAAEAPPACKPSSVGLDPKTALFGRSACAAGSPADSDLPEPHAAGEVAAVGAEAQTLAELGAEERLLETSGGRMELAGRLRALEAHVAEVLKAPACIEPWAPVQGPAAPLTAAGGLAGSEHGPEEVLAPPRLGATAPRSGRGLQAPSEAHHFDLQGRLHLVAEKMADVGALACPGAGGDSRPKAQPELEVPSDEEVSGLGRKPCEKAGALAELRNMVLAQLQEQADSLAALRAGVMAEEGGGSMVAGGGLARELADLRAHLCSELDAVKASVVELRRMQNWRAPGDRAPGVKELLEGRLLCQLHRGGNDVGDSPRGRRWKEGPVELPFTSDEELPKQNAFPDVRAPIAQTLPTSEFVMNLEDISARLPGSKQVPGHSQGDIPPGFASQLSNMKVALSNESIQQRIFALEGAFQQLALCVKRLGSREAREEWRVTREEKSNTRGDAHDSGSACDERSYSPCHADAQEVQLPEQVRPRTPALAEAAETALAHVGMEPIVACGAGALGTTPHDSSPAPPGNPGSDRPGGAAVAQQHPGRGEKDGSSGGGAKRDLRETERPMSTQRLDGAAPVSCGGSGAHPEARSAHGARSEELRLAAPPQAPLARDVGSGERSSGGGDMGRIVEVQACLEASIAAMRLHCDERLEALESQAVARTDKLDASTMGLREDISALTRQFADWEQKQMLKETAASEERAASEESFASKVHLAELQEHFRQFLQKDQLDTAVSKIAQLEERIGQLHTRMQSAPGELHVEIGGREKAPASHDSACESSSSPQLDSDPPGMCLATCNRDEVADLGGRPDLQEVREVVAALQAHLEALSEDVSDLRGVALGRQAQGGCAIASPGGDDRYCDDVEEHRGTSGGCGVCLDLCGEVGQLRDVCGELQDTMEERVTLSLWRMEKQQEEMGARVERLVCDATERVGRLEEGGVRLKVALAKMDGQEQKVQQCRERLDRVPTLSQLRSLWRQDMQRRLQEADVEGLAQLMRRQASALEDQGECLRAMCGGDSRYQSAPRASLWCGAEWSGPGLGCTTPPGGPVPSSPSLSLS